MKMKQKHGKLLRGLTGIAVALLCFAATVALTGGRAEAKSQDVMTGKGGWDWTFWGNSEPGDSDRTLRFARVYNRETGEVLKSGWHKVDDYWYYFNKSGCAKDQFHGGYQIGDRMGLGTYDVEDEDPVCYKWVDEDGRWKYVRLDGSSCLKSRKAWIDNKLYIFDADGYLPKPGWYQRTGDGLWYYIKADGSCTAGWKKLAGKWYFFDYCTGRMAQKGTYDTKAPFVDKASHFIFTPTGAMREKEGWLQDGYGDWFYSEADGKAAIGWRTLKGKDYFFEPGLGGQMAASTEELEWYQSGRYFGENGAAGPVRYTWHEKDGLWWYGSSHYYVKDGQAVINGWSYEFNDVGYSVVGTRLSDGFQNWMIHEDEEDVVQWDESYWLSEQDTYLLAAIIYTEAGGEDYIGQVAVGNVMLNRLRSGKYGKTLEDVVYQPYQFSVTGSRSFRRSLIHGGSSTALRAAKEAMAGKNVIGLYDSFRMHEGYDLSRLKTEWMILGCHVFYYEW